MNITGLHANNFMAIGEAQLNLKDQGLVLLQGENNDDPSADSNGSGKSSIADAFMWCLTGETARGITGDAVVNETAEKGCAVVVQIQDGAEQYEIARHRKHPVGKNKLVVTKDGIDITQGTTALTQSLIYKLLGANKEVLMASVYAAQDAMVDLPAMADKALKGVVEHAAGIQALSLAQRIAAQRTKSAKEALDGLERKQSANTMSLAGIESHLVRESELEGEFVAKTEAARQKLDEKIRLLYGEASAALKAFKSIEYDAEHHANVAKQVDEISTKVSTHSETSAKLNRVLKEKERGADGLVMTIRAQSDTMDKFKKSLADVDDQPADTCPHCERPHDNAEHKRTLRLKIEADMNTLSDQMRTNIAEHEETQGEVKELKDMIDALGTMASYVDEHQRLSKEHMALGKVHAQQLSADRDVKAANDAIIKCEGELEEHKEETKENPYTLSVKSQNEKLELCQQEIKQLSKEIDKAQQELLVCEAVSECYKPSGVRARVLDSITPYLNERTQHYLSELSDGQLQAQWNTLDVKADGELRENFHIFIESVSAAQSYKGLSGGEKRKVKLACCLALQDLIAQRASKDLDLFIADEIDDALDASGLERLMTLLESRARTRGTLLIISHNDLKDWVRETATVTKSGGQSTISGALAMAA